MTSLMTIAVVGLLATTGPKAKNATATPPKKASVQRPDICGPMIDAAVASIEEGVQLLRQDRKASDGKNSSKTFEQWLSEATGSIANVRSLAKGLNAELSAKDRAACLRYATSKWRVALQPLASPQVRKKHAAELRRFGALFRTP